MSTEHPSSSHVQLQAEKELFLLIQAQLGIPLESNPVLPLANNGVTFIQPDFFSEAHCVVGEIFAHVGKPKKAQDNKIAHDILKMLLLEKVKGKEYRKILIVCDQAEMKKLKGTSALAEAIRRFNIELRYLDINETLRNQILQAQALQRMTNAD